MPSSQNVVKPMLSSPACTLLMNVKETLQNMNHHLSPKIFAKFWQKYAKMADSYMFNEVGIFHYEFTGNFLLEVPS